MRKVHLLVICNACHESEVMELYRIADGKWSALMADGNLADLGWLETDDGDLCPFCHQNKIDASYSASKEVLGVCLGVESGVRHGPVGPGV